MTTEMTRAVYYFSYGSNMSSRRLLVRVPLAKQAGTGMLHRHQLKFHKISKDGSAKCDILETGNPAHVVHGVLFHITPEAKTILDRIEGTGFGYAQKTVDITMADGSLMVAFTYYATDIDSGLKPLDWYKQHVLTGARENRLPENYIRTIEAIECVEDTDDARRETELSIYR